MCDRLYDIHICDKLSVNENVLWGEIAMEKLLDIWDPSFDKFSTTTQELIYARVNAI